MTTIVLKSILRKKNVAAYILLIIAITSIFDIFDDLLLKASFNHIFQELILLALSLFGIIFHFFLLEKKNSELVKSNETIAVLQTQMNLFKKEISKYSSNISAALEHQFNEWDLSDGEKDIALLLIKGCSMKEVAEARNTAESTVRQQASSIYKKSNLNGRKELTAFFLESLL